MAKLIPPLGKRDRYWIGHGTTWTEAEVAAMRAYDTWAQVMRDAHGDDAWRIAGVPLPGEEAWDVFKRITRAGDGSVTLTVIIRLSDGSELDLYRSDDPDRVTEMTERRVGMWRVCTYRQREEFRHTDRRGFGCDPRNVMAPEILRDICTLEAAEDAEDPPCGRCPSCLAAPRDP